MNYAASRNKPATKAKGIIDSLINTPGIPEKSKNLLIAANGLVRKGNTDIIRKVLSIGEALSNQDVLFSMSQEEIDYVVSSAIEKIVDEQRRINGKPFVYIGLAK